MATVWDFIGRILTAAQDTFDSVMGAVTSLVTGEPRALPGGEAGEDDPRILRSLAQQVAFTISVIGLGAKMAKADGVVTQSEVNAFHEVFHVPAGEERNVRRVFDLARQDVAGYEGYAQKIARLFRGRPGVLEDLLDGLFHIAKADGVVHHLEVRFLATVADIFGFTENEFERIRCSHMGCPQSDPYAILGVDRDISDRDLKKAYHRLVRENHPDALIARGVPEEFIGMATAKLSVINTAYDRITGERARVVALA